MAENGNRENEDRSGAGAQPRAQTGNQPQQAAQTPQVKILAHFVRDLSFENVGVVQGTPAQGQPDISVAVHLDGAKIGEDTYQLNMKITAKATREEKTRFLVELDYGGVFSIQDAPETHIHPILFIECPRQLFPFARRVVSDVTRDGGYPPLMIDNVDFAHLYRQRVEEARRKQAASAEASGAAAGNGPEGGDSAGGESAGGDSAGGENAGGAPEGQKPN